ncbi:DNA-directed RNA polymerase III subunit RPC9 [Trichogramma pretiosum]|uniref:DNA-directed RNA polymerase III subunit RPC9 n=1 Tax=Trichogramma pretiosum TaxID=7493 RepID=UPI0006C97F0F|nr:DNA-directed RNA polymerase III subunit RPC9 [Trichogramma pretiosum]
MEVVNDRAAFLTNYEVYDVLNSIKASKTKSKGESQLATITYSTIKYLEDTPCKDQTADKITGFMTAVESFKLSKSEKLTILNLFPTTVLELHLLIEDCEERFNEEEEEKLLMIIAEHLETVKEEPASD